MSTEFANPLWRNGIRVARADVVSQMKPIEATESQQIQIASFLSERVIGQDSAMERVARRVVIGQAGFNDPDRPLSSMIFLGPTGVGKTETAYALAEYFFEDRNSPQLKLIDCAEYAQFHMVSRLVGSPPGYVDSDKKSVFEGDFLKKHNIIVFDEIEKAHPEFCRLLLGILDKRRLAVKTGTELNFANSHIIFTSNIGAEEMQQTRSGRRQIGYSASQNESEKISQGEIEAVGLRSLRKHFRQAPEFLGRIDDTIVFNDLEPQHYDEIFWKFMEQKNRQLEDRLSSHAPYIAATQEAQQHLLGLVDRAYGARDIRGVIEQNLFARIADLSFSVDLTGKAVVMDVEEGTPKFYLSDLQPYLELSPGPSPDESMYPEVSDNLVPEFSEDDLSRIRSELLTRLAAKAESRA